MGGGSESDTTEITCEVCGKGYDSQKGLSIHQTKVHEQGPSKDDLINDLKAVARQLNRPPSRDEFAEFDGYNSPSVYRQRFGSWNTALREAGLEPNQQDASQDVLVAEAERLAEKLGRNPKLTDLTDHGKYGTGTVYLELATMTHHNDSLTSIYISSSVLTTCSSPILLS